jgi:hypothetical protein
MGEGGSYLDEQNYDEITDVVSIWKILLNTLKSIHSTNQQPSFHPTLLLTLWWFIFIVITSFIHLLNMKEMSEE